MMRRPIVFGLLLASLLLPTFLLAADQSSDSAIGIEPENGELASVLRAPSLNGYYWAFHVSLPNDAKTVSLTLQLASKFEPPIAFGPMLTTAIPQSAQPASLIICIEPIGDSLVYADHVRITISGFNTTVRSEIDNPLRGVNTAVPYKPEPVDANTFNLAGCYKSFNIVTPITKNADDLLSLNIKTN